MVTSFSAPRPPRGAAATLACETGLAETGPVVCESGVNGRTRRELILRTRGLPDAQVSESVSQEQQRQHRQSHSEKPIDVYVCPAVEE